MVKIKNTAQINIERTRWKTGGGRDAEIVGGVEPVEVSQEL